VWWTFWVAFWIAFGLLMAFSPEFRTAVVRFLVQIPRLIVHVLHVLMGQAEI